MDEVDEFITQLEKEMVEAILEGEMDTHLGYPRYDRENKKTDNSRNGYTSKEVYGKSGKIRINVPRDRDSEDTCNYETPGDLHKLLDRPDPYNMQLITNFIEIFGTHPYLFQESLY